MMVKLLLFWLTNTLWGLAAIIAFIGIGFGGWKALLPSSYASGVLDPRLLMLWWAMAYPLLVGAVPFGRAAQKRSPR